MTNNSNYQPSSSLLLHTQDDPIQCIPSQGMGSQTPQQKLALKTRTLSQLMEAGTKILHPWNPKFLPVKELISLYPALSYDITSKFKEI